MPPITSRSTPICHHKTKHGTNSTLNSNNLRINSHPRSRTYPLTPSTKILAQHPYHRTRHLNRNNYV